MEKKEIGFHFRCTKEEGARIRKAAKEEGITESEYLRRQALRETPRMPPEITQLLADLRLNDLKIGVNINQIARACNGKRFLTQSEYQRLVRYLVSIEERYQNLTEKLEQGAYKHGGHQVIAD